MGMRVMMRSLERVLVSFGYFSDICVEIFRVDFVILIEQNNTVSKIIFVALGL